MRAFTRAPATPCLRRSKPLRQAASGGSGWGSEGHNCDSPWNFDGVDGSCSAGVTIMPPVRRQ